MSFGYAYYRSVDVSFNGKQRSSDSGASPIGASPRFRTNRQDRENRTPEALRNFLDAFQSRSKSSTDLCGLLKPINVTYSQASQLIEEIGVFKIKGYLIDFGPDAYKDDNNQTIYYALVDYVIDRDPGHCTEIIKELNPHRLPTSSFSNLLARALTDTSGDLLKKITQDIFPADLWYQRIDSNLIDHLFKSGCDVSSMIGLLTSVSDGGHLADQAIFAYYGTEPRNLDLNSKEGRDLLDYLKKSKSINSNSVIEKLKKEGYDINRGR